MTITTVPADRQSALARLAAFLPRAGHAYAQRRNFDPGPGHAAPAAVSGLSPYLRYRVLDELEVVHAVQARHGAHASGTFVEEVCWRTYWKGWLEQRPSIWRDYCHARDALTQQGFATASQHARLERALHGQTGIAAFDAWRTELQATGYLHNHARMWFASIWIFTLRLPWELGAALFLRELLDGDPASNTLSWRWVAGLHTRGKHYLARAENIHRFTEGRFDPQGQLDERAAALESADATPPPLALPELPVACRDVRSGLLLHIEDLGVETIPCPTDLHIHSCAALAPQAVMRDAGQGDAVIGFASAALADARTRLALLHGRDCVTLPDAQAVLDWARTNRLSQVLTAYAPVGPTADQLAAVGRVLDAAGIALVRLLRRWDRSFWPHAQRGFFQLKARIPAVLDQLSRP